MSLFPLNLFIKNEILHLNNMGGIDYNNFLFITDSCTSFARAPFTKWYITMILSLFSSRDTEYTHKGSKIHNTVPYCTAWLCRGYCTVPIEVPALLLYRVNAWVVERLLQGNSLGTLWRHGQLLLHYTSAPYKAKMICSNATVHKNLGVLSASTWHM